VEIKINPWEKCNRPHIGMIVKNICMGARQDAEPNPHFFLISKARRSEQSHKGQTDDHRE
jgi:hypothetical protein